MFVVSKRLKRRDLKGENMKRTLAILLIITLLFTNIFSSNYSVAAKNSKKITKEEKNIKNKSKRHAKDKEKRQIIIKYASEESVEQNIIEDQGDNKSLKVISNKKDKKDKKQQAKQEKKQEKQQKKEEKKLLKLKRKQEKKVSKEKKTKVKNNVKNKLNLKKIETKKEFKNSNIELLEIDESDNIDEVIQALSKDEGVVFVQPNYKLFSESVDKDERYNEQWALKNTGQSVNGSQGKIGVDLNVERVWEAYGHGKEILVGVLDSEIDITHQDIQASLFVNSGEISANGIDDDGNGYVDDVVGWDFYNEDVTVFDNIGDEHGTHIAGIIGGRINQVGIQGLAPNSKILPLKFMEDGEGYTSDVIKAIEYAESMGVSIINCSFGSSYYNMILEDVIANSEMMFICAAGNHQSAQAVYPAAFSLENVIAVGASDSQGEKSRFSNYGDFIDVYAPGENILSTLPNEKYGYKSGTSIATANVTGVAALAKSYGNYNRSIANVTTSGAILIDIKKQYKEDNKVDAWSIIQRSNSDQIYLPDETVNTTSGSAINFNLDYLNGIDTFEEMDSKLLQDICNLYNIDDVLLNQFYVRGYSVKESIYLAVIGSKYNYSVDDIDAMMINYVDVKMVEREIRFFETFIENNHFTEDIIDVARVKLVEGYELRYLQNAIWIALALDCDLETILYKDIFTFKYEKEIDERNITSDIFSRHFCVDQEWLENYLLVNNLLLDGLFYKIESFKNNIWLVGDDKLKELNYDIEYEKYETSPLKTGVLANDFVDLRTGEVAFQEVDLSLPGKNGLDFNLVRRFDGYNSYMLEPYHALDYATYYKIFYYFKAASKSESTDTAYLEMLENSDTDIQVDSMWVVEEDIVENRIEELEEELLIEAQSMTNPISPDIYYIPVIFSQEYIDWDSEGTYDYNAYKILTNNKKRNYLGQGWSFAFPYIEFVAEDNNEDFVKYFHTGEGMVLEVNQELDGQDNGFVEYDLNDIVIEESTRYTNEDNITSRYVVTYKNQVKDYFDSKGRLIGRQDKAGNRIDFINKRVGLTDELNETVYRYLLCEITDSYNRKITFDYSIDEVIVNVPGNSTIEYKLEAINQNDFISNDDYNQLMLLNGDKTEYKLTYKKDQENRQTDFEYDALKARFSFTGYKMNYSDNYCLALKEIKYPSEAKRKFFYDKNVRCLGNRGSEEFYSVERQYLRGKQSDVNVTETNGNKKLELDGNASTSFSKVYYDYTEFQNYSGVHDGGFNIIPQEGDNNDIYSVITEDSDDVYTEYTFNYRHLLTNLDIYTKENDVKSYKSQTKYEYDDYKLKEFEKNVIYNEDGKDKDIPYDDEGDDAIIILEEYAYDTKGEDKYSDVVAYWGPLAKRGLSERVRKSTRDNDKHKIGFEYDKTSRSLKEKTYFKDENTKIIEKYEIDQGVYKPKLKQVYTVDVASLGGEICVEKTAYDYNNSTGEIEKILQYYDIDKENYIETTYDYSDLNSSKYTVSKKTKNVRDADHKLVTSRVGDGVVEEKYYYECAKQAWQFQ